MMKLTKNISAILFLAVLGTSCSKDGGENKASFQEAATAVGKAAVQQNSQSAQAMPQAPATGAEYVLTASSVSAPSTNRLIDFSWKDASGATKTLSSIAKGKTVMINFWATWCPPCRKEIPDIVEVVREYKDVVVIGVALERSENEQGKSSVASFATKNGINYINLVGGAGFSAQEIAAAYGSIAPIDFIPMTFVFNKTGQHVVTIQGGTTKQGFVDALKKAM